MLRFSVKSSSVNMAVSGSKPISANFGRATVIHGKSAYELAVENGFEGTEEEWLDSLRGEPGTTPHIGENSNWFIGETDTGVPAGGSGLSYDIGHGLKVTKGTVLEVDTVNNFEGDNTLPITAAAVQTTVGNIEELLKTI